MRTNIRNSLLAACLAGGLIFGGCTEAFEPFQENDLYFSIYGYLDAAADTQFVAVTPLRKLVSADAGPIDAAVMLEHLETGRTTSWRDSLFRFSNGSVGHVFWSKEPVEPGHNYRFTVTRSDGATTATTVRMPASFPDPELRTNLIPFSPLPPPRLQNIGLLGIEKLVDLRIVYTLRTEEGGVSDPVTLSYVDKMRRSSENRLGLAFDAYEDVNSLFAGSCPQVLTATDIVGGGTSDWPDFFRLDDEMLADPDLTGDIRNGMGFLGGAIRWERPWSGLVVLLGGRRGQCLGRRR